MPFAGYKNFADCVRKNSDKDNPRAYCGSIMHDVEGKQWESEVNNRLDVYGQTDYQEGVISVNTRRGDVVNTIIHERLHAQYPEMSEEQVQIESHRIEGGMGLEEMEGVLRDFRREVDGNAPMVHTRAGNVVSQIIK